MKLEKIQKMNKAHKQNKLNKKQKTSNPNKEHEILEKAQNTNPIRILYKKSGQSPEVKIINNVLKLKKFIIKKNLDIIPYETVYIICTKLKNQDKTRAPNIVLDFYSIIGDLILVDIDRKKREFKGLSQEDIIWYTQDLINKSFNNNTNTTTKFVYKSNKQKGILNFGRDLENDYSNNKNFETSLLQVLTNIELVLASILKDNKESVGKKNG